MAVPKLNWADPGDTGITYAHDAWTRALAHAGRSEAAREMAREWREMYLGLLTRKDARQAREKITEAGTGD